MNRIIPTIGLLVVGVALTATSVSAQHYGYGHGHHGYHARYDHGHHHGGHGYHSDYLGGYHSPDYLVYPVHPPVYVYAAPVYDEPVYVNSLGNDYDCPDSGYCPQAVNGFGQQYAPVPLHSQQDGFAYGPTQGLNNPSHDGHDHGDHSHGPVNPGLQNPAATFGTPDRQPMAIPTLPNRNAVPELPRYETPRDRPAQPSSPPTNDGPVRMDGPPPSLTTLAKPPSKVI